MNNFPLWAQLACLAGLILLSAFFSMTETALMAANRHRLRHLANRGNRLAVSTLWLLERVDKLLAIILIINTVLNASVTALVTALAIETFGNDDHVLTIATAVVAFLLIIFAEIAPKVIGARYPERISLPASVVIRPLMTIGQPIIWFVNIFVNALLRLLCINTRADADDQRVSPEELRSIVVDGGNFIPQKHKSILLNLFDLEAVSVNDVMTPRAKVEALDLSLPIEEIKRQLSHCEHNKIPVYEDEINHIIGILSIRTAISLICQEQALTKEGLRKLLKPPYFIPEDTDVFTQLQYFQENQEKLGIIIDEYGEVRGLVTREDIIEEMIDEFSATKHMHKNINAFVWDDDNTCLLEGTTTLRDINKRLGVDFPLEGPKTLNGLLLEYLQEIPEANVCCKVSDINVEILVVENQSIKLVKLVRRAVSGAL